VCDNGIDGEAAIKLYNELVKSPGANANPTSRLSVTATEPKEPDEPPLERPMSPDEQRGFSAPADWLKNEPGKEEL